MEEKELTSEEKKEAKKPRSPRKRKTYPKQAEGGMDVAGSPQKYPEAHANKYAPKEKIGTPTLGRSSNYVTTVGLGGLKVIHNGRIEY
jgi:hypothetical protein